MSQRIMDSGRRTGESSCHDTLDLWKYEPFSRFSAVYEYERLYLTKA